MGTELERLSIGTVVRSFALVPLGNERHGVDGLKINPLAVRWVKSAAALITEGDVVAGETCVELFHMAVSGSRAVLRQREGEEWGDLFVLYRWFSALTDKNIIPEGKLRAFLVRFSKSGKLPMARDSQELAGACLLIESIFNLVQFQAQVCEWMSKGKDKAPRRGDEWYKEIALETVGREGEAKVVVHKLNSLLERIDDARGNVATLRDQLSRMGYCTVLNKELDLFVAYRRGLMLPHIHGLGVGDLGLHEDSVNAWGEFGREIRKLCAVVIEESGKGKVRARPRLTRNDVNLLVLMFEVAGIGKLGNADRLNGSGKKNVYQMVRSFVKKMEGLCNDGITLLRVEWLSNGPGKHGNFRLVLQETGDDDGIIDG